MSARNDFPRIDRVGIDGLLIRFDDRLTETANRAALALRAALDRADLPAMQELSASLVSVLIRFDALRVPHAKIETAIMTILHKRDWYAAELPQGRRLWRVPAIFGGDLAPQLNEAAGLAGLTPEQAIQSLTQSPVRVQTIGFAPGQPYLGTLPKVWDIPRQTGLTKEVPPGAIAVAIRQLVMFSVASPTGWRHVGQTALRLFRPDVDQPFILRPGDEVLYEPVNRETFETLSHNADGGAVAQVIK